jgi:hypothetical protein
MRENAVDIATLEFLDEIASARSLQLKRGAKQLDVSDFILYLRIDPNLEPELIWIAREMCCSPLPGNAVMMISKSNLVFFHDTDLNIFTTEHPLTQRFLKVLEWQRMDLLSTRRTCAIMQLESCTDSTHQLVSHPSIQLPCQDCGCHQSTAFCEQCISSFCDACFNLLHASGSRTHHTRKSTPSGSSCGTCKQKETKVYCNECNACFCIECFGTQHNKGDHKEHRALRLDGSSGNIVPRATTRCCACADLKASIHCDFCQEGFCLVCFWRFHVSGNRRRHTASITVVNPLCNRCEETRASLYCMQCHELYCSACFAIHHTKGQRKLHLFVDAMNFLLLLEKLDKPYQEFISKERHIVFASIVSIQAHFRGFIQRRYFKRRRELATTIQKRWRGIHTRKNLMTVLDQFNWRKKQVVNSLTTRVTTAPGSENHRAEALESRIEVATRHQSILMQKLRKNVPRGENRMTLGLPPVIDPVGASLTDTKSIPSNAGSSLLRSRIAKNLKESDKLKHLLNLNEADEEQ